MKGFEPFSSLYESDEITIYSTSAFIGAQILDKSTIGQIWYDTDYVDIVY